MTATRIFGFTAAFGFALAASACLPEDTRTPPGELVVTVSSDEALSAGIASTEDGWAIEYTRFLVVLGDAELDGDDCDAYSESHYSRIFELLGQSHQRVSILYGLGHCQFGFRISTPAWDSLLGAGVSADDETLLRTPGSDAHATNAGVSVHIEGAASRLGVKKVFNWSFRRFIMYGGCSLSSDATEGNGIVLSADQPTAVDIRVRGAALFQNTLREPPAPARFEPFRAADDEQGDANGEVTLDELQNSPLPQGASASAMVENLGDRVYLQLLPQLAQYQGTGSCKVLSSPERPDFGGP